MMNEPPQILRIKRKRDQDPLQALILDAQPPKRSKANSPVSSQPISPAPEARSWFFQLSGTDPSAPSADVLASVLAEADSSQNKRQFVIPKPDDGIPNQLAEMLDSFLNVEEPTEKRKRRGGRAVEDKTPEVPDESDDYVFDVYKLSSTTPLTNSNYPQSQIGYIRFFDDEEYGLLQSDDEKDSQGNLYSDDEDSNAESFYQNDYPEDEDAGTYSDTYENLEAEEDEEEDDIGPIIVDSAEGIEANAYLKGHVQADQADAEPQHFDDLYDDFFDDEGHATVDFLQNGDDDEYERQQFFNDEEEDELAMHRDRIFGRLQKMINDPDL